MGRAKLKMELMPKDKSRNTTYLKRKKLMKKTYEFSTLCGVDACMIIYGPNQGNRPIEPDTYPENPDQVQRIINRYISIAKEGRTNRNYGIPDFFEDVNKKMEEALVQSRKSNDRHEFSTLHGRLKGFNVDELKELTENLDSKIEMINSRINLMKSLENVPIDYSRGAANQNPWGNTFDDVGAWERENDIVYQQQQLCFATSLEHQAVNNMDLYPSDTALFYNNILNPTTNNGCYNFDQFSSGPIGCYPYPTVRNSSYTYDPMVKMPWEEIALAQGAGQCFYQVQPTPSYPPCFRPGSSSTSSSSEVIQNPHHHPQPSDELSILVNNRYIEG